MAISQYDAIYLSPHLDDVALSCGGQIVQRTQQGERVLVATITAGDPPAQLAPFAAAHHRSWGLDMAAVAARRQEDLEACRIMGSDAVHYQLRDAIYRGPRPGVSYYDSDDELFGTPHHNEAQRQQAVTDWLRQLPPAGAIYCPLALGNHVDHQIARAAAEAAFAERLVFYEDLPYAALSGVDNRVAGWQVTTIKLSPSALAKKIEAVAAYQSQIVHLFGSRDRMVAMIQNYAVAVGGERLWQPI